MSKNVTSDIPAPLPGHRVACEFRASLAPVVGLADLEAEAAMEGMALELACRLQHQIDRHPRHHLVTSGSAVAARFVRLRSERNTHMLAVRIMLTITEG